jgi:hypothetical protein
MNPPPTTYGKKRCKLCYYHFVQHSSTVANNVTINLPIFDYQKHNRGVEHDHKASQAQQDKRQTLTLPALHSCIAYHTDH